MEPKFVTQEDFKTFLDTFKKEMDVLKDTINENKKNYNEIKKNQQKNDVITNKIVDKIVDLFKIKSDDDISKKSQNKELKNIREEDKEKKSKSLDKKKKGKKQKNKDETAIIEKLRYIEIQNEEDNVLYKYALSKIYNNQTIYYYCADTHCKARLKIIYEFQLTEKIIDKMPISKIELTAKHTLNKEEHNYIINREIKEDLISKSLNYIKKKMKNYIYLFNVIKEEGLKNSIRDSNGSLLYNFITNKYGEINIDYSSEFTNKYFNREIQNYKKLKNKDKLSEKDYKDIINVRHICSKINSYINNYYSKNKNLDEQLKNITLNNIKITETDIVTFIRKNKKYKKDVYYFLTNQMKDNLSKHYDINQWFLDATYYAIPRKNNSFKLLLLLGFNKKENITVLGAICLIKNENEETFKSILEYLNINYKFEPKIINVDCNKAEIIAIKKTFLNTKINICYYHLMKKFVQHLPELRSKNKILKNKAKDLLINIKLLVFIKKSDAKYFFDKIYDKYNRTFPKFTKYFKNNFFNKYPLKDLDWNYDVNNENIIDINHYFFTNNICESTNRTLNMNYKGACKSILSFEIAVKNLIKLYDEKKPYVEDNFSKSRALAYFVTTHEIKNLITNNIIKEINLNYKNYLKTKNNKIIALDDDSDSGENNFISNENINSNNDYSSNTNTNSSDSSDSNNNIELNRYHDNNNSDRSSNSSEDNIKENYNKNIIKNNSTKNNSKENKKNNYRDHKNKKNQYIPFLNAVKIYKEDKVTANNIIGFKNIFNNLNDKLLSNDDIYFIFNKRIMIFNLFGNNEVDYKKLKIDEKEKRRKIWVKNKINDYRRLAIKKFFK